MPLLLCFAKEKDLLLKHWPDIPIRSLYIQQIVEIAFENLLSALICH